jgi:hypothetical protein
MLLSCDGLAGDMVSQFTGVMKLPSLAMNCLQCQQSSSCRRGVTHVIMVEQYSKLSNNGKNTSEGSLTIS